MPLYFKLGPRPRPVVELDRRTMVRQTAMQYLPVSEELTSEELSVHELDHRLNSQRAAVRRLTKRLSKTDGDYGGPASDKDRARTEHELRDTERRIPRTEVLLADAQRRVAMLQAVMAGKQTDDRLGPPPQWFLDSRAPAEPDQELGDDPMDPEARGVVAQVQDRVVAVAQHLDRLGIPTDIGRGKVRQLLGQRDPGYRIGDAPLSAAIRHRQAS
ncbi:hypothetical protein WHI96_02765 [Pseudonocardia tropica]|uniref:Uncharacterized protein n=1 Tax=Pseudonocardia tropica TaxID=681289 RepID=A0ABV1JP56_9PSEU